MVETKSYRLPPPLRGGGRGRGWLTPPLPSPLKGEGIKAQPFRGFLVMIEPKDLNIILATDCGSTITKAILIEKKGEEYRQTYRGESPTTVESPFEDVTRGALNSFTELEELSGRKILDGEKIIMPARGDEGVDVYVSTS